LLVAAADARPGEVEKLVAFACECYEEPIRDCGIVTILE